MNEKDKRLAAWCKANGYEGVYLRRRSNIAWLTDGADVHVDSSSSTGVGALLWTPRKKVVFCDNIEDRRLREEEFGNGWSFEVSPWWEARKRPRGRLATDFPDDPLADLRAPLTALELKRIRQLGALAASTLEQVLTRVRWQGSTEHALAGSLSGIFRSQGVQVPVLLVAADDRIAKYRHPIPTARKIGKLVMVAVCPRQHGLMVALTRLVHFGKSLSADLRRRHDAVCRIDAAFHAGTFPGRRWCDILADGIRIYEEMGYPAEWRRHHQGGPMGYEGRDFKATPAEERAVLDDQPVGWNPSITGTKSEDTILSSGEILTAMRNWPLLGGRPDILCR